MRTRRETLATMGAVTGALGGCVDILADESVDDSRAGDDAEPADDESATPGESMTAGDCGTAAQSLSTLLTDEIGDPDWCFDGAKPSFVVENERKESVAVRLEIEPEDFERSYTLDPGERVVERTAFEARADITGTVTVDDQEWTVEWAERSCYRHGVALLPDDVEVGRVEPLQGPGDTQHDCYPGADIPLQVSTIGNERTVTVAVDDLCTGETTTETVTVAADERERLENEFVDGSVYEVTVDIEDGGSETEEFRDVCWGMGADVTRDGEIRLDQLAID